MSSVLHLYAYVCAAALFANIANCLFSKSFEQFAPEERVEIVIKNNICLNKFTFLSRDCFEFPKRPGSIFTMQEVMKVETFKLIYGNSMGCRLHRRTIYGGKNKIVFHKCIMAHPYPWKDHREVN